MDNIQRNFLGVLKYLSCVQLMHVMATTIDDLPNEILLMIFEYLTPEDLSMAVQFFNEW
jgi:hypothetical protein